MSEPIMEDYVVPARGFVTPARKEEERALRIRIPALRRKAEDGVLKVRELKKIREFSGQTGAILDAELKMAELDLLSSIKALVKYGTVTVRHYQDAINRAKKSKRDDVILEHGYKAGLLLVEILNSFRQMHEAGAFEARIEDNRSVSNTTIHFGSNGNGAAEADALLAHAIRGLDKGRKVCDTE